MNPSITAGVATSDILYILKRASAPLKTTKDNEEVVALLFQRLFAESDETGYMTRRVDDAEDNRGSRSALYTVDNSKTDDSNGGAYPQALWCTTPIHDQLGNACFSFVCDFLPRMPWMVHATLALRASPIAAGVDRNELAQAFASVRNHYLDFRDQLEISGSEAVESGDSATRILGAICEYTIDADDSSPFNYALDNFGQFSVFLALAFFWLWDMYSEWKRTAGNIPDVSMLPDVGALSNP